ncbi:helix-turn-helix domain-containing protein [Mesorhizobium sp.]|uniref:helix-turn-helix domain-containing protein n=1 Tax=Mesorhizobium sp. TaxID=1871066 RepID=UPI000FEA4560|nr:helix-turn-helix domain-containing protein [Mesorhizobium sp.]RWF02984.1 MAG: helix-turn-helix domain-containing protein [Mesorhizobium sp.]
MSHAATKWAFDQPEIHRDMKPSEWAVLMVLADCHNPVNGCFPSQDYICSKTNLAERAVRDQLTHLRERGLIDWDAVRENGKRGSNRYRLGFEPDFQPANSAGSSTGEIEPVQPADSDSFNRQNLPPNLVREPVKEPVEREREREEKGEETPSADAGQVTGEDTPGTAAFEKRVMRFCNGRGFMAGPWPDWDTSSPGWIAARFAALSSEERLEAERWRDPYLLDLVARKKTPVPVGVFFKGKTWTGLDAGVLERAEKQRIARLPPDERARPEGWAKCLGPVGMARLFAELLDGQSKGLALSKPFVSDAELREAWPFLWRFRALLRQKGGAEFGPRWHALKTAMEPVPQGTETLAAWKSDFLERGWLWLAEFDRIDVVYCPAGGPAGLEPFEQAVRGTNDDASGREAAE